MKYNPVIHKRKSIRLNGYDYSQAGMYFITICVQNRKCLFGNVERGEMMLNEYGFIANNVWKKLPDRFANFELDVFQIMPNHIHGIIVLQNVPVVAVGAGFTPAQNNDQSSSPAQNNGESPQPHLGQPYLPQPHLGQPQGIAPTNAIVGNMVGAYKSLVANGCLDIYKSKYVGAGFTPAQITPITPAQITPITPTQIPTMGKLWQRNYYEHIIRNQPAYETISNYIINNPANWQNDKFYT